MSRPASEKKGTPSGAPFVHPHPHLSGLAEELALERLAHGELLAASDAAWRARDYARARQLRREAAEADKRIMALERER